jgi:Zn-dependent protease with chaperone function
MMLVCVLLIAGALLLMLVAPLLLSARPWQVRHPRLALSVWFAVFTCGAGAVVLAVPVTLIVNAYVMTMSAPGEAIAVIAAAWLGLGSAGVVVAFAAMTIEPFVGSLRVTRERLTPIATAHERCRGFTLVWFESDEPLACAVPGRPSEIFISTRLRTVLTAPQLRAVIAHERAHLRYRHGWAVLVAELNAHFLSGRLAAGHALRRATLLTIELIADDAAAKEAGAANLANALARMSQVTGDPTLALRAERLTMRRWPTSRRRRLAEPIRV